MSPLPENLNEHLPLIGCVAWDENEYSPPMHALWVKSLEAMIAQGNPMPRPYPNSTSDTCDRCGIRIAVGPMQQAALLVFGRAGVAYEIMCLICAAMAVAGEDDSPHIVSLGNTDND